ncbi:MAG: discoidin domain-containing protein [Phycisphaeraceae bacterium]|nr:discoidin domain-containing protein [Phycisphaeraceae bacterium]
MIRNVAISITLTLLLVLSGNAFAQNMPAGGWAGNVTIGNADVGDATGDEDTFTVTGNGTDIQGTADHCQFLYKEMVGDGSMWCRVVDNGTGSNAWCKGGIMVRQTTEAVSMGALMPITGGNGSGSSWQWRLYNDGGTNYTNNGGTAVAPPYYVKIERTGDEFSGSLSPDGITWTQLGATQTIAMGDTCLIGLAVTSHAGGELRTYTFDSLGFSGGVEGLADPGSASDPVPDDEDSDIIRDSMLTWSSGQYPATHNVYFGSSFDDVNSGTVPTAASLAVNTFDPGRLEFGQTYFWRVDEVNASPDKTVYKGNVWSFEVEPYSYQIPGSTIGVTASSASNEFSTPETTIDGSGLGADDTHDMGNDAMWFTAAVDLDPWIQFEFEGVYKMDIMKVWNSNSAAEAAIGWGVKDVEIQYSADGETWDILPGPHQLSRAPGSPAYNQFDTVSLDGVAAKFVRLNIQSNWGGLVMSYGLSEIQFMRIPAQALSPMPASDATDILPNATISWRAGREAAQHVITIGTDVNAVTNGSAPSVTTTTNSLSLSDIDAQLGHTYYWRVDEVNETETLSVWTGPVWSLSTSATLVVDDFEGYSNSSPDRPFQAWLDGFGYSADDFFSVGYGGNGTGAGIGHDIWSLSSPYFDGSIMETAKTMAGSGQSMPFYYGNTGGVASQTDRKFAAPQDWTVGGAKTLSLGILGQADNTGSLYIKINNTKRTFDGDVTLPIWQPWQVDLTSLGINLNSITTVSIGVDGAGASGMVLIDEIRVYRIAPEPVETVSLVNDFDSLAVGSNMHDVPGWEGWFGDAQYAAKVTDTVAYSGSNALEIVGARDDLVPHWPLVDSGYYVASVMQYVPTGTGGSMYFGPLSSYGSSWDDTAWLGTLLSNCDTDMVYVNELDAGRTEAPLLRDQWVELRIVMNFDADTCEFYYGDTLLGTLECPSAMGFDVWPDDNVDVIYYDDFRFESP